jgi:hypothetical protein
MRTKAPPKFFEVAPMTMIIVILTVNMLRLEC